MFHRRIFNKTIVSLSSCELHLLSDLKHPNRFPLLYAEVPSLNCLLCLDGFLDYSMHWIITCISLSHILLKILRTLSKTTPSARRGGQLFEVSSLSIERTDDHVLLKASCCLRSLLGTRRFYVYQISCSWFFNAWEKATMSSIKRRTLFKIGIFGTLSDGGGVW